MSSIFASLPSPAPNTALLLPNLVFPHATGQSHLLDKICITSN